MNSPKCYAKNGQRTAKLRTVSYSLCRDISNNETTFLGTVIFDEAFSHAVFTATIEHDNGSIQELFGCILLGSDGKHVHFGFTPETGVPYKFRVYSAAQDGKTFYMSTGDFFASGLIGDKEEEDHEGQIFNEYTGEWVWL